jgi:hypothetical protein
MKNVMSGLGRKKWFLIPVSMVFLAISAFFALNTPGGFSDRPLIKDNRSAWFLSLYDQEIPLFLDPAALHPEVDKADLYFLSPAEILPHRRGIVTCAVVGSSGNLKEANFGPEIDDHTFVFRMNEAPTKGYEKDVGSRTTFRVGIFTPDLIPELLKDEPDSIIINYFNRPQYKQMAENKRIYKQMFQEFNAQVDIRKRWLALHPAFYTYTRSVWFDSHRPRPSTGMVGLILAIHLCDTVTAYGFGANKAGDWHHYYKNYVSKQGVSAHNFRQEEVMRNRMESEKLIQVRYP